MVSPSAIWKVFSSSSGSSSGDGPSAASADDSTVLQPYKSAAVRSNASDSVLFHQFNTCSFQQLNARAWATDLSDIPLTLYCHRRESTDSGNLAAAAWWPLHRLLPGGSLDH